jgi:hypothetical protein
VDAILTGVHERGESHFVLLRAFANDCGLTIADLCSHYVLAVAIAGET